MDLDFHRIASCELVYFVHGIPHQLEPCSLSLHLRCVSECIGLYVYVLLCVCLCVSVECCLCGCEIVYVFLNVCGNVNM